MLFASGVGPAAFPLEVCLHETVEVAVENSIDIADFVSRTKVLHHLVRLRHVGANLTSKAHRPLLAADVGEFRHAFFTLPLSQFRPKNLHRPVLVLVLASLVLT